MNHTGITPDQLNAVYIQFLAPSLEHQVARENYTTAQNILGRFHKRLRALLKYLEYFGFLPESFLESLYMGFKAGCCSESGDGSCDKKNEEDYHFK
ncbi:hypothetical protein NC651_019753 [Populus alba x Populus x berolinensis]|nr:hypothetical protein NC651_019753 [Populus alba x Populus x berolinensis]